MHACKKVDQDLFCVGYIHHNNIEIIPPLTLSVLGAWSMGPSGMAVI